ncbi:DMT family transporter [uncultured Tateyamaria sp.]|uniref:DMT family transporter n=1 Tax=uncultured Tateyamaria sp. TaxID=455651 RepID=UPI00260BB7B7|nr:DMT family transporter [uncultured Tateyamaria sp.]
MIAAMQMRRPAIRGAALMVTTGALFAGANTLVQYATMGAGLQSTTVAFWQYAVAFLFMLPLITAKGLAPLATRHFPVHLIQVVFAAAGIQFWVMGLAHVPIWQAIALAMLSPFFVTIGARIFLRERIAVERWIAVATGFLGGMIILSPWSDRFTLYAILPVIAAALWAIASLLMKRLTQTESPATITFYVMLLLTPINLTVALGAGDLSMVGGAWAIAIAAGILTGLAQFTLASAYSVADASFLQPFDHLKLPVNVVLGIAVFGFMPPGSMLLGSAFIVGASLYLLRQDGRALAA